MFFKNMTTLFPCILFSFSDSSHPHHYIFYTIPPFASFPLKFSPSPHLLQVHDFMAGHLVLYIGHLVLYIQLEGHSMGEDNFSH